MAVPQLPTYATAGVYIVCLTITTGNGCVDDICTPVTITGEEPNPVCEAFFNYETTGLVGFFNGSPSGGNSDIIGWQWSFGDGTGSDDIQVSHTYAAAGTYNVCLTITTANGCIDDYCHTVTVSGTTTPVCAAHFNFETEGLTAWFNGITSEANGDITGWVWSFGDGTSSDNGAQVNHTYSTAGTYTVCLIITTGNGCVDDICHTVTVTGGTTPLCAAHFNFETEGLTAWFNGNTSEANGEITGWVWSFGDGTSSDNGAQVNHTYTEAGTYTVCLTITTGNGCVDDICHTVTVTGGTTPLCAAHFNFETEGLTAWFNGNTSEANSDIISWVWSFGEGTTSGNGIEVSHTFAEAGTYTVCLTITTGNGCVDDICQTITVTGGTTPVCAAHFNFETEGLTAWFNGNTSEANSDIISWVWSFGDGTSSDNGAQVNHTYTEAGTYTVCLTITTGNGCVDDICHTVTVTGGTTPLCAAHFNFETEGLTAWFNGNPSEANGEIISWVWSFGDGTGSSIGAQVNHVYSAAGSYTVCLIITTANGCMDDLCQTVTVTSETTPVCEAYFNFETEGLTAWFNGNPSTANGDIANWSWSFGDGTSATGNAEVNHIYAESGTYTVCLTITTGNGCVDDYCHTVTVSSEPPTPVCEAHFNFETDGLTVWFNANPSTSNGTIVGWLWSFGDESGSADGPQVNHTYTEAGTYNVCVTITTSNGCVDDYCHTVTVAGGTTPTCEAFFHSENNELTVFFNGNPSTANSTIVSWEWSFGDGTGSSSGAQVNHAYSEEGQYVVCLIITASNGCTDDYCKEVNVILESSIPACSAHFNFETEGLSAWFNGNASESNGNIESWSWDFGDGTSSTAGAEVNHAYTTGGTYTVCLVITTNNECEDDYCFEVIVENPASGNKLAIPYNVTTNENITAIITLENAQPVKVLISDLSGRRTKLSDLNLLSGENQIELNIGNQLPGTYFVAIELANGSLLKQRIFKLD